MAFNRLVFRIHAVQRMFQRDIKTEEVRNVLATGETIEDYPDDSPYPSRLILGWSGSRPLHLVVADNAAAQESIVVTVYEPDRRSWEPSMRCPRRSVGIAPRNTLTTPPLSGCSRLPKHRRGKA